MLSVIPFNVYPWLLGSITLFVIAYKSLHNQRNTLNLTTKLIGYLSLSLAFSWLFISIPSFFTNDPFFLRDMYLVTTLFFYIGLFFASFLLRHLIFSDSGKTPFVLAPLVFGISGLYFEFQSKKVLFYEIGQYTFIDWNADETALLLEAIVLVVFMVPIGIAFLRNGIQQKKLRNKLKSFTLGTAFTVAATVQAYQDVTTGTDSIEKVTTNMYIFGFLLILVLFPWEKVRLSRKEA